MNLTGSSIIKMKSRTFRTCQNILHALIEKHGPFAKVGEGTIDRVIIEHAGGDPRTVKRYREQLVLLHFIKIENRKLACDGPYNEYSLNWKKVLDSAQLRLHEGLAKEPP